MKKLLSIFAVCATIALVLLTGCPNVSGGGSGGGGQEEKIQISGTMSLKVSQDLLDVANITVAPFVPKSPDGSLSMRAAGDGGIKAEKLDSPQWEKEFKGDSKTVGFEYIIEMKSGVSLLKDEYEFVIEKNIQATTTKGIMPIESKTFRPAKIERTVEKTNVQTVIENELNKWNNCFLVLDSDGKMSEGEVEDFGSEIEEAPLEQKTEDELLRTTTKRAHAIGSISGGTPSFAKSFAARIGNPNSAVDTADFIAIAKGQSINDTQAKSILKAGLLGKHIVLVEPTAANIADFWAKMNTALTTDFVKEVVKDPSIENVVGNPFYASVKRMKDKTSSVFKNCLAYKVHKNGVHIILPEARLNDREYGLFADSIIESIEEDDSKYLHPAIPANDTSLPDVMNAQKVEYTFKHEDMYSETIKVQFFIWQVYSFDDKADYYLVQETVTMQNSQLKCGPSSEHKWWKDYRNHDYSYGPYMQHVSMDNVLNSANNIYSVAPNTTSGSSSYTEGFSWNIGGNVGFNMSGPTGGISGGVSYSNSTSRTVPDLEAKYKESTTSPHWDYEGHNQPDWYYSWGDAEFCHYTAPATYTNDTILNNNWVWRVDNPSGSYSFDAQVWVNAQYLVDDISWGGLDHDFHHQSLFDPTTNKNTISMDPPSRTMDNYLMSYETPSDWDEAKIGRFRDFLTQYFKLWQPNIDIYSVDEAGNQEATKDHFTEVVEDFKNNKQTFKDNQFTGTFKFKIKNKTAPDTEYLMTETIDIN